MHSFFPSFIHPSIYLLLLLLNLLGPIPVRVAVSFFTFTFVFLLLFMFDCYKTVIMGCQLDELLASLAARFCVNFLSLLYDLSCFVYCTVTNMIN